MAETVEDVTDGARGHIPWRIHRTVDVRPTLDVVLQVALLLEPSKNGADRDLLEVTTLRHHLMHGIHGAGAAGPHRLHHLMFEFAERAARRWVESFHVLHVVTVHPVTCQSLLRPVRKDGPYICRPDSPSERTGPTSAVPTARPKGRALHLSSRQPVRKDGPYIGRPDGPSERTGPTSAVPTARPKGRALHLSSRQPVRRDGLQLA